VDVRLLGPVEVVTAGQMIEVGPPQRRAVFAALAVDAGRQVTVETIIERVWGNEAPALARRALHAHITRIRRTLEQASVGEQIPVRLLQRSGGYLLDIDPDRVDRHRFRYLLECARGLGRADLERVRLLREALALWRGEPLAGLTGQWAARTRQGWCQQRLDAVLARADAELRVGNPTATIGVLTDLAGVHPFLEPLVAVFMRALYAAGLSVEALDLYSATRQRLVEELGAEPGAELRRIHWGILRDDLDKHGAPPAPPAVSAPSGPLQLPGERHGLAGRTAGLAPLDAIDSARDGSRSPTEAASPAAAAASDQADRVRVGLPRIWQAPARITGFVPRETLIDRIGTNLESGPTAICGMAGVGKSRLAVEFAHQRASDYDIVWWIDAEQEARIPDELTKLAVATETCGPGVTPPIALAMLNRLLRRYGPGRWLIIFDNADAPDRLVKWLPTGLGHTLITSRNPIWTEVAAPVRVDVFNRDQSCTLLCGRVPDLDAVGAALLAADLGDLPLALAQAAGLMAAQGMSADEYRCELARHAPGVTAQGRPPSYPTSLASAVHASTDRLTRSSPAAARLLNLCALLAPEVIPVELLREAGRSLGIAASDDDVRVVVRHAVAEINRFGIARLDNRGLLLHRLVQAIIRDRLPADTRSELYRQAQRAVAATAPRDNGHDPVTWPRWQAVIPHVLALNPAEATEPAFLDIAVLLPRYWGVRGQHAQALRLATQLRDGWTQRYGPDDRHALNAAQRHGFQSMQSGAAEEGYRECERTWQRMQAALGPHDPDTLNAECSVAMLTSDPALGYQIAARNLASRRQILGPDHEETLWSAVVMSEWACALGRPVEAADIAGDVWARLRQVVGDDHTWTTTAATSLADNLYQLGQFTQARDILQQTIYRVTLTVGADHPQTRQAQASLALVLAALDDTNAAADLGAEVVHSLIETMGADHPWTIDVRDRLSDVIRHGRQPTDNQAEPGH
jgi:DNA-binding SARP family transcriptional activator